MVVGTVVVMPVLLVALVVDVGGEVVAVVGVLVNVLVVGVAVMLVIVTPPRQAPPRTRQCSPRPVVVAMMHAPAAMARTVKLTTERREAGPSSGHCCRRRRGPAEQPASVAKNLVVSRYVSRRLPDLPPRFEERRPASIR